MPTLKEALSRPDIRSAVESLFLWANGHHSEECEHELLDHYLNQCFDMTLSALGELAACTRADLHDAWNFTIPREKCSFEVFYEKFAEGIAKSREQTWLSEPQPLDLLDPFVTAYFPQVETIWESQDSSYGVYLLGRYPAGRKVYRDGATGFRQMRMFVSIKGTGSFDFFKEFCEKVSSSVSALLNCAGSLAHMWIPEDATNPVSAAVDPKSAPDQFARFATEMRLRRDAGAEDKQGEIPSTILFIRDCLDALFCAAPVKRGKDSVQRRVSNAVRLLIEAKHQRDNAIGLALSVSAIEALVCRKGENVTQMFTENMAVLLEPELQYRAAAEKWCKKLYERRSGVLHGSSFDLERADLKNAECAAIAVLKAMVERRRAHRRLGGEDESPDDLLMELKDGKYNSGQPIFVVENPITRLWRTTNL